MRPGDLITALGGEPVRSAQDLVSRVAALQARRRGGARRPPWREQRYKIKLKVLERPTRPIQRSS